MLFCVIEILVNVEEKFLVISDRTFRFAGFLGVCTPHFFVGRTKGNSFARDLAMLFDIAILNVGTFITGASVRNFVFADLCAFEVSNRNIPFCIS